VHGSCGSLAIEPEVQKSFDAISLSLDTLYI
jgi:hypothetical protein